MDRLQGFELSLTEEGVPLRLVVSGTGSQTADEALQQEILAWAQHLYESLAGG